MARRKLGELLVQAGLIDDLQLRSALAEHRKWGRPLGRTMVEMRLIDEKTLISVLSHQLNIPAVDIENTSVSEAAVKFLSADFCLKHICLPFRHNQKGNFLDVAMADPTNLATFDLIRVESRCNLRPYIAGPVVLEQAIRKHFYGDSPSASGPDNRPWLQGREGEQLFGGDSHSSIKAISNEGLSHASTPDADALKKLGDEVRLIWDEVTHLTTLLERDERVLKRVMALLVEKGLCSREEIMSRISKD